MRGEVSQLLADYDQRQAGLEEMLSRVNAIVTSTDQTGQSLTRMGEVWTELIRNLPAFAITAASWSEEVSGG